MKRRFFARFSRSLASRNCSRTSAPSRNPNHVSPRQPIFLRVCNVRWATGGIMRVRWGQALWVILMSFGMLVALPRCAYSQGTSGPIVSDSKTGYIDGAIPGDVFRFRYDTSSNNRRPTRAEFLYAQGAPNGPGWPRPESSVDYQDILAYA